MRGGTPFTPARPGRPAAAQQFGSTMGGTFGSGRAGAAAFGPTVSLRNFLRFTLLDNKGLQAVEHRLKEFVRRRRVHRGSMLRLTSADAFELFSDPAGSMYSFERGERRAHREGGGDGDAFREYAELFREQQNPAGVRLSYELGCVLC